ncbi:MAG: FkbM family methyltransferase [Saprospiraceae bacterium]|tara:strand:+ start:736 stop:1641 length:906 start_codon:yes stop_codon:yes gene_type:complete
MLKDTLLTQLQTVSEINSLSKVGRLLNNPLKYAYAMYCRIFYYALRKEGIQTKTTTFFGDTMNVLLPAGTDIYLTSGKAHDSEIRLSSYIINILKENDTFVDVGAHFGFFSLLAAMIVGSQGKVIAFEGGIDTYQVLHKNINLKANILANNKVVSNTQGEVSFYQFPAAYSEYSSLDIEQYKDTDWIKNNPPKATIMDSIRLSQELKGQDVDMIKVDVEGGELEVLSGLSEYLINYNPIIIIEYLSADRNNQSHVLAAQYLVDRGYKSHIIDIKGEVKRCDNLMEYMKREEMESDNIVFLR